MAARTDWTGTCLGIGIGIVICGVALIWPNAGGMLIALGSGIAGASLLARYFRPLTSVVLGCIIAAIFFAGWVEFLAPGRQDPFHLSLDQKREFAAAAVAPSGGPHWVMINVSGNCQDCQVFQYAIRDILNDLPGWKAGVGYMIAAAQTISGIEVWVPDRAHQTEAVLIIEKAFQKAHIEFHVVQREPMVPRSAFVPTPSYEVNINLGPQ